MAAAQEDEGSCSFGISYLDDLLLDQLQYCKIQALEFDLKAVPDTETISSEVW